MKGNGLGYTYNTISLFSLISDTYFEVIMKNIINQISIKNISKMKKNYAFVLSILCLFSLKSSAQESIIGEINYGLLEKYIEAAREYYPRRQVFTAQAEMAKIGVTTSTLSSW